MAVVASIASAGVASTAGAQEVSDQDRTFLAAAHQSNLAEITVGELATQRGANQQVRDLGQMLVDDHRRLDQSLQQVAQQLGVELPAQPSGAQQAVAAELRQLSGAAFDQRFVSSQIEGHQAAQTAGETELARGSSPEAQQVARDAAPVVAEHLAQLQQLAPAVGAGTPDGVDAGTGGQVADRATTPWAVGLIAVGCLLALAGAHRLRRRYV